MDEGDDEDIYAPDEGSVSQSVPRTVNGNAAVKNEGEKNGEDEEEGEEVEEEESDSVGAIFNPPPYSSLIVLP